MKRANRHETLVNRLRQPFNGSMAGNVYDRVLEDKLNAIGEALAYIIDKKHRKRKVKKAKKAAKKAPKKWLVN